MNAIILSDKENIIFNLREKNVMIDLDLAEMYEVSENQLRINVSKNASRFPDDFIFELNEEEVELMSKYIPRFKHFKKSKTRPLAFTESGISMLSAVLNTEKSIQISIAIMRAFTHYRSFINEQSDIKEEVQNLDVKFTQAFQFLLQKIDSLHASPDTPMEPIGFKMGGIS